MCGERRPNGRKSTVTDDWQLGSRHRFAIRRTLTARNIGVSWCQVEALSLQPNAIRLERAVNLTIDLTVRPAASGANRDVACGGVCGERRTKWLQVDDDKRLVIGLRESVCQFGFAAHSAASSISVNAL